MSGVHLARAYMPPYLTQLGSRRIHVVGVGA